MLRELGSDTIAHAVLVVPVGTREIVVIVWMCSPASCDYRWFDIGMHPSVVETVMVLPLWVVVLRFTFCGGLCFI
jgi:hypothetical protein